MCPRLFIADIIHSGESLAIKKDVKMPVQGEEFFLFSCWHNSVTLYRKCLKPDLPCEGTCERCGYISSQPVCKACVMLEGLNQGLPKYGFLSAFSPVNMCLSFKTV